MMYNMKYFKENAKKVDSVYSEIYDLDGHIITISQCERCTKKQYYNVRVDGTTIATRTLLSNTIRLALNYLNTPTATRGESEVNENE